MLAYAGRRLAGVLPTLFVIVTLSFFVIRLAPGGPFDAEEGLAPQIRANLEAAYGLDRPLPVQYLRYLSGLAHGRFGPSFKLRDVEVSELIAQGLPVSLTLGVGALALALLAGVPLGIGAALRHNSPLDRLATTLAVLGMALPSFVVGPVLVLVFGLRLGWLPVALPLVAQIARLVRGGLLEVLRADFVRTARAKGLSETTVVLRHALRPALAPLVSFLGPATATLVTGSLVVETLYGLPGTGRYLVEGAINRDYTLVMGMVVVYGALTLLLNLIADLIYGWLDPRVRYASGP